jgi:hypothetical protein
MIALGWLYWTVYQILSAVVMLVGFPVVGILAACRAWHIRESYLRAFPGPTWAWRGGWFTALWSNEEDGVGGMRRIPPTPWAAFVWCAWRNSANGMRLLPLAYFELPVSPAVRYTPGGYVATVGWRQCRAFTFRGTPYRIGWMIDDDAQPGWRSWPVIARRKPGT